jgi:hypothetical protein
MCFVWISEQTATFALKDIKRLVFITEVESVYSAVRPESLYKTDYLSSLKGESLIFFWYWLSSLSILTQNTTCDSHI